MSVKSKDEILVSIRDRFADDNSDEVLSFLEDVTDTFNDLESKVKDNTDWKAKAEQIDSEWREKYKARFFSGTEDDNEPEIVDEIKTYNYEDLFREE